MLSAIRAHATTRNLIAVLTAIGVLALISHGLALPAYRAVASGFDPFDVQSPLTRAMVAIQRGAFRPGVEQAYLSFIVFDALSQVLIAVLYALLWAWIMTKSSQPLMRDGLLLLPILAVLCGMAEKAGFLILVLSNAHVPRYDVTTMTLNVHRIRSFLDDANMAITLTLTVFTMYFRARASAVKKTAQ